METFTPTYPSSNGHKVDSEQQEESPPVFRSTASALAWSLSFVLQFVGAFALTIYCIHRAAQTVGDPRGDWGIAAVFAVVVVIVAPLFLMTSTRELVKMDPRYDARLPLDPDLEEIRDRYSPYPY